MFIADLSSDLDTKVILKEKQKFTLHDEALISFGGIVKYSTKYKDDKSLIQCDLDPNFDDADLKKNPPPNQIIIPVSAENFVVGRGATSKLNILSPSLSRA